MSKVTMVALAGYLVASATFSFAGSPLISRWRETLNLAQGFFSQFLLFSRLSV
ncbi:MAG: hypothetical protein WCI18_16720 [Pseudomonadota bacterium]